MGGVQKGQNIDYVIYEQSLSIYFMVSTYADNYMQDFAMYFKDFFPVNSEKLSLTNTFSISFQKMRMILTIWYIPAR